MYICLCSGVTERQIGIAVAEGATKLRDLRECLGVAADCGRCAQSAKECLRSATAAQRPAQKVGWAESAARTFNGLLTLEPEAS
ncbi:MAG TPA: (2Fe-2S)-binding protein [Rhodocyclaceae bacterium]|nr:(2Fe-2S)-binding protein [Zoogloeaceae bacterium]HRD32895.1 (2Fe-2S)-binding protein [Rhodocyclaceae bacterium]